MIYVRMVWLGMVILVRWNDNDTLDILYGDIGLGSNSITSYALVAIFSLFCKFCQIWMSKSFWDREFRSLLPVFSKAIVVVSMHGTDLSSFQRSNLDFEDYEQNTDI